MDIITYAKTSKIGNFVGDLNTDLGSYTDTQITEKASMSSKTVTVGGISITTTANHMTANGTSDSTEIRVAQDNIEAPAGNYVFDIGTEVVSSGLQLQIQNKTDKETICALNSSYGGTSYSFTLASAKTLQIRFLVVTGNNIDDSHDIHLYKVVTETTPKTLANVAKEYVDGEFAGKKILAFGDSIWGDGRTNGIANYLAEYSGATVYNAGIGGTRITGDRSQVEVPKFIPFDGVTLIHAYLTNTWTAQDAGASEVWEYVSTDVLPMLKSLDIQTVDIVVLAYGTNDFSAPKTASAVSTAFLSAISELLTANPKLRILCIVPPWRMFESDTVDGDVYVNGNSDTLYDFDADIVEAIKAKHIEVLNMFERCPWRAETKTLYLKPDAIHPNKTGNQVYAHIVHGKLRSMY